MRKIRIIAQREFFAAVRTKAFILTLALMPVIMGASVVLQIIFHKMEDAKEKRYAVIDHTQGQVIGLLLQKYAADFRENKDPAVRALIGSKTTFDLIPPADGGPSALAAQRYDFSRKIENGDYEALIEIGPKIIELRKVSKSDNPEKTDEAHVVRFQAKNAGAIQFARNLEMLLNLSVQGIRLANSGIDVKKIADAQQQIVLRQKALTRKDDKTGEFVDGADETRIINLILPGVLIALMFMIVMIGATPAMHGVVEEKSQRIAEVLLGSATPFELMGGKLLGLIGVSLSMAAVYLGGGYFIAWYYGFAGLLPLSLIAWFLPMLVLALLIFGSLFIAVGAAASNVKDTQTLLMPIMMTACLPMFALGPILQDPSGPIARVCSLFPFSTPMLLVARQSVPPGVPLWEMLTGIALVLITTFLCVWAAGRIFRIGILSQGKTPQFMDLVRWAVKG